MKRLPIFFIIVFVLLIAIPACHTDNGLDDYIEWYNNNADWLKEQQKRTNDDGTPYFKTLTPSWNPSAYVLIHYFNDRAETAGNLSPIFTSTVDTRYHLEMYDGTPVDSSTNLTSTGTLGIFRTSLSGVITGWAIALEDMHVGDTAEVVIPYEWAYGTTTTSSIPAYSNLKFNIRLVDIYTYEVNPK